MFAAVREVTRVASRLVPFLDSDTVSRSVIEAAAQDAGVCEATRLVDRTRSVEAGVAHDVRLPRRRGWSRPVAA